MRTNHFARLLLLTVALALAGCHREMRPPEGIPVTPSGSPLVRVRLLANADLVPLSAGFNGIEITDAASGELVAVLATGQKWDVVVFGPEQQLRLATPDGRVSMPHPQGLRIRGQGEPSVVEIGGRPYRGELTIHMLEKGRLMVVNYLPLEDYLRSVVPAEIGTGSDRTIEALKAQAVASRSYAMTMIERNSRFAFDLTSGTGDQVYRGMKGESEVAGRAVRETFGECVTRRGRIATAFYHSTCGGRTADPEEVWGDRFAEGNGHLKSTRDGGYDDGSKWKDWEVGWTREELLERVRNALPPVVGLSADQIGEPKDIEVMEHGESGRVTLIKVTTEKRILQVEGDRIRNVLLQPDGRILPSTWFDLSVDRDQRGTVIVARGHGFGHGLGMCQTGALARAADGKSYREILHHYYDGIRIERIY